MVTSDTYKLASEADAELMAANIKIDPDERASLALPPATLEAEPIWDSILAAAGNLDLTVGGPSFDIEAAAAGGGGRGGRGRPTRTQAEPARRLHDPRLFHQPRRRCRTSCRRSTSTTAARRARCGRKPSPRRKACS